MRVDSSGAKAPTITENEILGFFGPTWFLSNWQACRVEMDGLVFASSEAAYMSRKTSDPRIKQEFTLLSPKDAKAQGRILKIVPNWDYLRLLAMTAAVESKFFQNPTLAEALMSTGSKYLEETNDWNDQFWGVTREGQGLNMLGRILMQTRDVLHRHWG